MTTKKIYYDGNVDINGGDLRLQKPHMENDPSSWEKHILFTDEANRVGARITGKRETWHGAPMGLSFHTGGINIVNEQMTIKSDGKVGIGTANPAEKLEVNGNIKVCRSGARELHLKNGRNGDATVGSSGGWLRLNTNGEIAFWTNGQGEANDSPQVLFTVTGTIHCASLSQTSDGKLKKEVQAIDNALSKVSELRGVNYKWKDAQRGEGLQMGLIAQEVEKVLPELVSTDSNGDKSITYSNLTALLIEAVKELSEKLAKLESAAPVV